MVHFNVVELGNEHLVYFCVIARLIEFFELSHMTGARQGVSRVLKMWLGCKNLGTVFALAVKETYFS